MILFIIASIVIVVAIPTTRENGVMAFSCRPLPPSLAAALPRRRHSTPPPHCAASLAFSSQQQQPLLDAILFDCDGVLADTERDGHRISFNMAFASFGIAEVWDEERYGKLLAVGGGKERMVAHWVSFFKSVIVVFTASYLIQYYTLSSSYNALDLLSVFHLTLYRNSQTNRTRWDGQHKSQSIVTNA
jgi:hypothetical protein